MSSRNKINSDSPSLEKRGARSLALEYPETYLPIQESVAQEERLSEMSPDKSLPSLYIESSNHPKADVSRLIGAGGLGEGISNDLLLEILKSLQSVHEKLDRIIDPGMQQAENWMSTEQAAGYLGLSSRAVRVAAEQGRLPGRKNKKSRGSRWFFKRGDLDKWLVGHSRKSCQKDSISIW